MAFTIPGLSRGANGTGNLNKKLPTTGTPTNGVKATGTLGMATKPTANDTVTLGTNVYKFVATAAAAGDVAIGALIANSQANLVAAINDGDTYNDAHEDVTVAAFDGSDDMVATAIVHGTVANAIATEETFTDATDAWVAATLGSGVAGTGGEAGEMLVDDTNLYMCMSNDSGTSPSTWRKIAWSTL